MPREVARRRRRDERRPVCAWQRRAHRHVRRWFAGTSALLLMVPASAGMPTPDRSASREVEGDLALGAPAGAGRDPVDEDGDCVLTVGSLLGCDD